MIPSCSAGVRLASRASAAGAHAQGLAAAHRQGRRLDRIAALDAIDAYRIVTAAHEQEAGIASLHGQASQGGHAQIAQVEPMRGGQAQLEDQRAEPIAARRRVLHRHALRDQRPEQPMHGRPRQAGGAGEINQSHAGVGLARQQLQHLNGPGDALGAVHGFYG